MEQLRSGTEPKNVVSELREIAKSDLIVSIDYLRIAKDLQRPDYTKMVKKIEQSIAKSDAKTLSDIRDTLLQDAEFPNRSVLLRQVTETLHRLTLKQFELTFEQWQEIWLSVSMSFPKLTPILKETLEPPKRKIVRSEDITLVVYTTGSAPSSPVFLEISGGEAAIKLNEEISKQIG
jgi:hypothetical protein